MKLCSACLLGVPCRFDGKAKPNEKVIALAQSEPLIPFCPEQLAGLPTPRPAAENRNGTIIDQSGNDLTAIYEKGAQEALKLAKLYNVTHAILKSKSPSCGCGKVFDGTFSGKLVNGDGITAALFKKHGIHVLCEEDI